uniref:Uncharacterized protein n=1 Tax=Aegilops tauschii subsp. strangulata TaxID=200361 RepID=A0A453QJS6_AEGTS
ESWRTSTLFLPPLSVPPLFTPEPLRSPAPMALCRTAPANSSCFHPRAVASSPSSLRS